MANTNQIPYIVSIILITILFLFADQGNPRHTRTAGASSNSNAQLVRWTKETSVHCLGAGQQSTDHVFRRADLRPGQFHLLPMHQSVEVFGSRWSHHHLHYSSAVGPSVRDVRPIVHSVGWPMCLSGKHQATGAVPEHTLAGMSQLPQSG